MGSLIGEASTTAGSRSCCLGGGGFLTAATRGLTVAGGGGGGLTMVVVVDPRWITLGRMVVGLTLMTMRWGSEECEANTYNCAAIKIVIFSLKWLTNKI